MYSSEALQTDEQGLGDHQEQNRFIDTGCVMEDLLGAMYDTVEQRVRVREIRASNTTWRWYVYTILHIKK